LALDKETLSNISSFLFDEFLKHTDKYKTVSYFRRSPGGSLLMFKIMHSYFLNKDLHVEELIRKVPISIKESSSGGDKRKKSITPSDIFVKEYKDWLHHYISEIQS